MATIEKLKARLAAVINGYKAENKRFELSKNLQAAAENFKTAQDKTAAKAELKAAFLAVKNAGFILSAPLKIIFDQCSKVFGTAEKQEEITKTKIIICRHIISYQNMDCNKYTQMSIVLGQQAEGNSTEATHNMHFRPPFDVQRYSWAATSNSWLPESDPQLPPANETVNEFTNQTEVELYAQFASALKGNLSAYVAAYEKAGGQKYPLATANSILWRSEERRVGKEC